jgi:RNA polymerase sporulation-specific sigma factor
MTTFLTRGHAASHNERALLCAAQRGDSRAQEVLLRRYEPLVRHTVWRLRLPCRCDRDDIAQEARLALLRAIRAWQPDRGPFCAFAAHCVRTKTASALTAARARKHQPLSQALSLDWSAPPSTNPFMRAPLDEEGPRTRYSLAAPVAQADGDPARAVLVREQLTAVRAAWPRLTEKERDVLAGALDGKSYRQLAADLDCTVKAIDGALRRARRKLGAPQVPTVS